MRKLLVICGPTAAGKTQIGLKLAREFKGEIVSADSRQVYRRMDIATGKDLPVNAKFHTQSVEFISNVKWEDKKLGYYLFDKIPIWMLDVVEPTKDFSVAQYSTQARHALNSVWSRGKLPIVVGGTGLYIKAVVDGIETMDVGPDVLLRKQLEKKSTDEVFNILHNIDPALTDALNSSEKKNKRRLIRKIELVGSDKRKNNILIYYQRDSLNALFIGLTAQPDILKGRIEKRIKKWVKAGAEDEVKKLIASGVSWEAQSMNAIGYREWKPYIEGLATRDETIAKWKQNEWQYAKRQMTWFKRDKRIIWFSIEDLDWAQNVEKKVRAWYNS